LLPARDASKASPVLHGCLPGRYGNGAKAKMTLTTRLAIAMILLVAIAVSAVGWLNYRSLEQVLLPRDGFSCRTYASNQPHG
jgi:hypothetical protein